MTTPVAQIRSLIIELSGSGLLVPSAVIAEVANFSTPSQVHDMPPWMFGMYAWRNVPVPLISFEKIADRGESVPHDGNKVVVFYGVHGNRGLPFYAIVTTGIPRTVKIEPDRFAAVTPATGICHADVEFEQRNIIIPDLAALESAIAEQVVVAQSA